MADKMAFRATGESIINSSHLDSKTHIDVQLDRYIDRQTDS